MICRGGPLGRLFAEKTGGEIQWHDGCGSVEDTVKDLGVSSARIIGRATGTSVSYGCESHKVPALYTTVHRRVFLDHCSSAYAPPFWVHDMKTSR